MSVSPGAMGAAHQETSQLQMATGMNGYLADRALVPEPG